MEESKIFFEETLLAIKSNDVLTFERYIKLRDEIPLTDSSESKLITTVLEFRRDYMATVLLENGYKFTNSQFFYCLSHKKTRISFIEQLLNHGASVNWKNSEKRTALHHAFLSEAKDSVIDLLFDYSLKDEVDNLMDDQGLTYLHIASTRTNTSHVKKLIESSPTNIMCQVSQDAEGDYAGWSPLHFAVNKRRLEIAQLLLSYKADLLYLADINGSTPLHLAVKKMDVEMIDFLVLNDDRRRNPISRFGLSHFMAACAGTNTEAVREFIDMAESKSTLIAARTTPDNYDHFYPNSGYTPLHFAALFGRTETIRLLLEFGADCCVRNIHGLSIHNLPRNTSIIKFIKSHCQERRIEKTREL